MVTSLLTCLVSSPGRKGIGMFWEAAPPMKWYGSLQVQGAQCWLVLCFVLFCFQSFSTENLSSLLRDEPFLGQFPVLPQSRNLQLPPLRFSILGPLHPSRQDPFSPGPGHTRLPFGSRIHRIHSSLPWLQRRYSGGSASHGMVPSASAARNHMPGPLCLTIWGHRSISLKVKVPHSVIMRRTEKMPGKPSRFLQRAHCQCPGCVILRRDCWANHLHSTSAFLLQQPSTSIQGMKAFKEM